MNRRWKITLDAGLDNRTLNSVYDRLWSHENVAAVCRQGKTLWIYTIYKLTPEELDTFVETIIMRCILRKARRSGRQIDLFTIDDNKVTSVIALTKQTWDAEAVPRLRDDESTMIRKAEQLNRTANAAHTPPPPKRRRLV